MMFQKIHIRLTLLFTGVCMLLLVIMSFLYLMLSSQSILKNAHLTFENDVQTFLTNCENRSVISYEWLSKLESDGKYMFFLYDCGIPFQFVLDSKTTEQINFAREAVSYFHSHFSINYPDNPYASYYMVFPYQSASDERFLAGIGTIPGRDGDFEILMLYSLEQVYAQFFHLTLQFIIIILLTGTALFLFTYFYTDRLLRPIEENRKKQSLFIAAASHELRTPITTILSALSAMEIGNFTPTQQKAVASQTLDIRECLSIAKKEGARLSLLINDLLDLAGSDSNELFIQKTLCEPDTLLLDSYEAFLSLAKEAGLHLCIFLPKETVSPVMLDENRIKQTLAILLSNAVSYTPFGGTIRLSLSQSVKACSFTVADNGNGISDEDKPYIFDRFYRADLSRSTKDHFGLGLCIAKEIVTKHQGTITVSDTPGGGSTFTICIPLTSAKRR